MMIAPFQLQPRSAARVWGGDALARRFGRGSAQEPIGESWEIYGELAVVGGPYAGQTLDQVTRLLGAQLLGNRGADPEQGFPLLVKWLDCRQWLSLQLHPDDPTARRLTGDARARGKSECWFFLDVEEGAEVIQGHKQLPAPERWPVLQGRDWLELVERHMVLPRSWMYTPAGTIHALGPGLLLYEVQQSSDLTYRLYDWDRLGLDGKARPLHLAEAREVLSQPAELPPSPDQVAGCMGQVVVLSPYFVIEEVDGTREWRPDGESFEIITVLEPHTLTWEGGRIDLGAGGSALVAAQSPSLRIQPLRQGMPWIRVRLSCKG